MMSRFFKIFKPSRCSIIGMVHVLPLPGTPLFSSNIHKIIDAASRETEIYLKNGIHSILVENMHDIPYIQAKEFEPETTAMMTRICTEIRKLTPKDIPLGIQILACGNKEAIAVAQAADFSYIRAEGYVFSHIADEGFTDATAGSLLRYRKNINADNILVLTDIKKKHSSHAITGDISLVETAKAAEFFSSDGVILTGTATGEAANLDELKDLKRNCKLPVVIGSGITGNNFKKYLNADAFIIGSYFKDDGKWWNKVNGNRVKEFMNNINSINNNK